MSAISCAVRTSGSLCWQKSVIMRESCWSLMCCHRVCESALGEIVPSKCCAHVSGVTGDWYYSGKVTHRQDFEPNLCVRLALQGSLFQRQNSLFWWKNSLFS